MFKVQYDHLFHNKVHSVNINMYVEHQDYSITKENEFLKANKKRKMVWENIH